MRLSSVGSYPLQIPIRKVVGGTDVDLTGTAVAVALVETDNAPADTDFQTATLVQDSDSGLFYAQVTVGPGGTFTLTPGKWSAYAKFDDAVVEGGAVEFY